MMFSMDLMLFQVLVNIIQDYLYKNQFLFQEIILKIKLLNLRLWKKNKKDCFKLQLLFHILLDTNLKLLIISCNKKIKKKAKVLVLIRDLKKRKLIM